MSLVLLQIYVPWFLQFLHSSTEGRREWGEDIGGVTDVFANICSLVLPLHSSTEENEKGTRG